MQTLFLGGDIRTIASGHLYGRLGSKAGETPCHFTSFNTIKIIYHVHKLFIFIYFVYNFLKRQLTFKNELKGKNKGRCAAGNMITQGLPRDEFQHKVHVGCTQAISFRSL